MTRLLRRYVLRTTLPTICTAICTALAVVLAAPPLAAQQTTTVIVRLRAASPTKALLERTAEQGGVAIGELRLRRWMPARGGALQSAHRLDRYHLMSVPADELDVVLAALARDPEVEIALPNRRYRLHGAAPLDPLALQQWALRRIDAEGAWRLTRGSDSVPIGFVDTGIDFTHPDLAPSLWINAAEDRNGNGRLDPWPSEETRDGVAGDLDNLDQDGNGYTDDVIGFDFVDQTVPNVGDWSVRDGVPNDEQGHGTTVAGVIAAAHDNGIGLAGVAPRSPLMTLRAFDATGNAEDDDIAAAIVYGADNGARVLNLSFGDIFYSPLLHDAIRYATARGVVVVASAGNEGTSDQHYPSSYPEVIAVAMTDSNDLRNELSNFGSQITLAAPGVEVQSTARDTSYRLAGGTSIAAPYVSGVAALVLSRHPTWSPAEVRGVLELTADDLRPLGWDPLHGAGRLNARRAVEMEGPVLLAIDRPAGETGLRSDTTVSIVGSVHSPFIESWQLFVGAGEIPDTGAWRALTPPEREGRIDDVLGTLSTAGIGDTVLTLRLVLRQVNGRSAERRVRVLLDRSAPRVTAVDVRNVWRFDERAVAVVVAADDRTSLVAMIRPAGSREPFRPAALEAERTGLVHRHHLLLGRADLPRGVAHELFLVLTNAGGDTAMVGSADAPLVVTRADEGFPRRGLVTRTFEMPFGYMLDEIDTLSAPSRRRIALNRFDAGRFGDLVVYEHDGAHVVATDSVLDEWLPKDIGDTDGDGLRELLTQSGASTRIYEQRTPGGALTGSILFDDSQAEDTTLGRTLGAELVDLDGDGRDELIGRTDQRVLLVIDGDTLGPHYFIARNEGGRFRVVARLRNPTRPGFGSPVNHYGVPNAAVADFNGDGMLDILIADDDGDFVLHARDDGGDWRVVWTEENEGKGTAEMLVHGDFDGDGRVEAVTGYRGELVLPDANGDYEPPFWYLAMHRFDGPAFAPTTLWEDRVAYIRSSEPFRSGASAGDVDGRAGDELAVSIFPGLHLFRWSAARSTMEPLWWRFGSISNQPIIGDVDGDGMPEIGVGDGTRITFHGLEQAPQGPGVPGALAGWATSDSTVHVEWSPVVGAERYRVYRGRISSDTGGVTFQLVATITGTSYEDDGRELPAGRFVAGDQVAYAVTAVDDAATPSEGDYAQPVVVLVHAIARPIGAVATTDSTITVRLSAPVPERPVRQGAIEVRSSANGRLVDVVSTTYGGERALVVHLGDPVGGDSVDVRLTWLFRDLFDAPGDTTVRVGARLPVRQGVGERFIATRATPLSIARLEGRVTDVDATRIAIDFNAPVEPADATDPRSYLLLPSLGAEGGDGLPWAIAAAAVDPADPARVILTVDPGYPIGALGRNYTITITGVRAADGRAIDSGAGGTVGFTIEESDLASLRVFPHPFSISRDGVVTFSGLPRDARVEVVTQSGRRLRQLRETEHNGGVTWDGRDENGDAVATGIYLYRVTLRPGLPTEESELGKIAVVE